MCTEHTCFEHDSVFLILSACYFQLTEIGTVLKGAICAPHKLSTVKRNTEDWTNTSDSTTHEFQIIKEIQLSY